MKRQKKIALRLIQPKGIYIKIQEQVKEKIQSERPSINLLHIYAYINTHKQQKPKINRHNNWINSNFAIKKLSMSQ